MLIRFTDMLLFSVLLIPVNIFEFYQMVNTNSDTSRWLHVVKIIRSNSGLFCLQISQVCILICMCFWVFFIFQCLNWICSQTNRKLKLYFNCLAGEQLRHASVCDIWPSRFYLVIYLSIIAKVKVSKKPPNSLNVVINIWF